MNTILRIATSAALADATLTGTAFAASEETAPSCPQQTRTSGGSSGRDSGLASLSLERIRRSGGVAMTSDRQVIAVMAYPTFVDTRVAAANHRCRIIGALAAATSTSTFVWTPKLPTSMSSRFGDRFVPRHPASSPLRFVARHTERGTATRRHRRPWAGPLAP